ncbi:MAG: translation initiation factor IF-2 [Candidatus Odinarchaeum yellowstonii]|uniref:Probable translation initiation factor IF-2 n=1 Tax=Odinarchaeota yellowstonii (strain LCB_4) TaxID=1841599 RepID=A0AAF0D139_ODILC|nr:MAG: translation initiation factor IF-2 [Candidatus Odinarchaeum yellowstonii]
MVKRQPIIAVLGHIDAGKTSLLDKIRGTAVQLREAGGITQHVGASYLPIETVREFCGSLLEKLNVELTIPGLLIIDSPGHAVFMNLRRRAGSVCDLAVLVVDVTAGFQPQTYESINILRERKTPFIIAANKIDLIPGWEPVENACFLDSFKSQSKQVIKELDAKIYEIIGNLSNLGFQSERFDRIRDFTRNIAIVPTSAKTGEGIPELLMVLAGLAQQYLSKKLELKEEPAKGVILEVKEEAGLGVAADTILYNGILRKGDTIVAGTLTEPLVTKVKIILKPKPLDEIRDPRERFDAVDEVWAAAGVKLVAPGFEQIIAGAPLIAISSESDIQKAVAEIKEEINRIRINTDKTGVVVKADALGSLEAIVSYFQERGCPIRIADVGDVSKRDVIEAEVVREEDPYSSIILAFNVKVLPDAKEEADKKNIPIIRSNIIYDLFDKYDEWVKLKREEERKKIFENITLPGKFEIIPGYVFRSSKPAIVGVKVLAGKITSKVSLVNMEGEKIGEILQIQDKGQVIQKAHAGESVAVSIKGPTVGRQINEGDILFVDVPESDVKILNTKLSSELTSDEKEALEELIKIKRKINKFWGL